MINVYIPKDYPIIYVDFILFSIATLLLFDKCIHIIFRNSFNLTSLYGSHEKYNDDYPIGVILCFFICSFILKT